MRNDHAAIRKVMKKKKWWKSYEIQTQLHLLGKFYSESSITARLREMKPEVLGMRRSRTTKSYDWCLIE